MAHQRSGEFGRLTTDPGRYTHIIRSHSSDRAAYHNYSCLGHMKTGKQHFKSFNETINYSSCNEDTSSELKALDIHGDDVVLTITGGGARALDLLIAKPKKIIAPHV